MMSNNKLERFAAKLLFQFRVVVDKTSNKMRTCEERIVNFYAESATNALSIAQQKGSDEEYQYLNDEGNKVYFEFVGVMDLMHLGVETAEGDVWYEIHNRLTPKERKKKIIPSDKVLLSKLKY